MNNHVSRTEDDSRTWLFSFADLAFLLLIAFTQASTIGKTPIELGGMKVARAVDNNKITEVSAGVSYQIRIYGGLEEAHKNQPFQLVKLEGKTVLDTRDHLDKEALETLVGELFRNGAPRPLLLPDRTSYSKDMLSAIDMINTYWTQSDLIVQRIHGTDQEIR